MNPEKTVFEDGLEDVCSENVQEIGLLRNVWSLLEIALSVVLKHVLENVLEDVFEGF